MSIEQAILSNLITNEEYFRQAFPYIKSEYFPRGPIRHIFDLISDHYNNHKSIPTQTALHIALNKRSNLSQTEFDDTKGGIDELKGAPEDLGWLMTESEKYCQERAMYNALSEAIVIQENFEKAPGERNPKIPEIGYIQDLMKQALSVTFNTTIGHDYFEDAEARFLSYKTKANKVPFTSKILNLITKGGVEYKTLNLLMAGTNVGKSLGLVHLATDYLMQGYNVLYISMEMSEEMVGKRIDANLLDISMDDLSEGLMTEGDYMRRIASKKAGCGKLYVKQFPTGGANVNHFNNLLMDLKMKRGFVPQIVVVDYLGICASSRMKFSENSYTLVKAIAEELRGWAIENNLVVWSATQTNRGGWDSLDVGLGDIAESAGLANTADFLLALMENEELAEIGQQKFKQLKSRYGDKSKNSTFLMAVVKDRQRWIDVDVQGGDGIAAANTRQNDQYKENLSTKAKLSKMADLDTADDDIDWGA